MRSTLRGVFVLLALGLLGLAATAQIVQNTGVGTIDWEQRVVRAKGIAMPSPVGGRAGQIRAAKADALRQIIETVEGMILTSETTVENFMLSNDRITTEIRGVCRNFREVGEPVYMSDGSIELNVEMVLGPQFNDVLIGEMAFAEGSVMPVQFSDLEPGSASYTGLIVDCRELSVRPALAPRILSESGSEIYSNTWVDREWALQHGMVGYVRNLEQAREQQDRIGERPLVVKAKDVQGANGADVVIEDEQGKILHALGENLTFLRECRVLFVLQ